MDGVILIKKINILKELYLELEEQWEIYKTSDKRLKNTAYLALQKKAEEVIEFMIKINKDFLKEKNIIPMSYKESFTKLQKVGFDEDFVFKLSELAWFRNRLAHDYLDVTVDETIEKIELIFVLFNDYLKMCMELSNKYL